MDDDDTIESKPLRVRCEAWREKWKGSQVDDEADDREFEKGMVYGTRSLMRI